jgi:hypothetical protein
VSISIHGHPEKSLIIKEFSLPVLFVIGVPLAVAWWLANLMG